MDSPKLKVQEALLGLIAGSPRAEVDAALAQLLVSLKPNPGPRVSVGVDAILLQLDRHPRWRETLQQVAAEWIVEQALADLLADGGILGSEGFAASFSRRFAERLLPALVLEGDAHSWMVRASVGADAERWPKLVPTERWAELFAALNVPTDAGRWPKRVLEDWLTAIEHLACRLAAMGLEPELTRVLPQDAHRGRNFLALQDEVRQYAMVWRNASASAAPLANSGAQLAVLVEQCRADLDRIHRATRRRGASLALNYQLARMEQSLERLDQLLDVLTPLAEVNRHAPLARLWASLLSSVSAQHRVGSLIRDTTALIARRMADNASLQGEHYVADTAPQFHAMFRAALGAGFLIPLMALIKLALGHYSFAPFVTGLLNGLIYASGFVLIYLLGFVVATKQPAMTAARFADAAEKLGTQVDSLAELTVRTLRTQFIAIAGNVCVAFGLAVLLGIGLNFLQQTPLSPAEAEALLRSISPIDGLALWYAAIAGGWLFLAGVVSALGDNYATYAQIGARLRQHPRLQGWPTQLRESLAKLLEQHLGGVLGNTFFGLALGLTGAFGSFLGLPLDIRHIAFSSANLGYALTTTGLSASGLLIASAAVGVLLIGLVNLGVSFALALWMGLRARDVQSLPWRPLKANLLARARLAPAQFFFPPKELPNVEPAIAADKLPG